MKEGQDWEWKAGIYEYVECHKNDDKFDCELLPIKYYIEPNLKKEKWENIDIINIDANAKIEDGSLRMWCAGKILKCHETYRGIVRRMECRCEPPAELKKEERDALYEILKEYYEHENRFPRRVK